MAAQMFVTGDFSDCSGGVSARGWQGLTLHSPSSEDALPNPTNVPRLRASSHPGLPPPVSPFPRITHVKAKVIFLKRQILLTLPFKLSWTLLLAGPEKHFQVWDKTSDLASPHCPS